MFLVWLGTLAFLCCVAGKAQASTHAAKLPSGQDFGQLQLCLTAFALWGLASWRAAIQGRQADSDKA